MAPRIEDQLAQFFGTDARGAVAAYLFGSVARDEAAAGSDVDVAVLFDTPPSPTLSGEQLTLQGDLERLLLRPVDLIVLNSAPADVVHRVLRDGRLVLDRDPGVRVRFEVRARNEFFDLELIRRRYRRPAGPAAVRTGGR